MDKYFPIEAQIEIFSSAVRGDVVTPADAGYDAARAVANGAFDPRPLAVISAANAADVAAAVNFARATDLPLAVRSGGHSLAGHSSPKGGIVVDLRGLNGIEIDVEARTMWAGAGLTAGQVTTAAQKHGLIVGFGDASTVGIGGITLGGGIGFLTRKHGMTIDFLLAAEVVTASGDIVIADAEHHPDLFWALRGGGGNFGIVTRFKYRLQSLPAFTGGPLILPATAEVIAGFVAAAQAAPEDLTTIAMVMPAPPLPFIPAEMHGRLVLMGMMAFAGDAEAAQPALAPFRALATPIADLVGPAPYASMYLPEEAGPPPCHSVRSRFVETLDAAAAQRLLDTLGACDAPMKMAQIRVLGGAMARVSADATAFAHRTSPIMLALIAIYGGGPDVVAAQDRWAADGIAAACDRNAPAYVNFLADEGPAGLTAAYPPATLARLRAVKRRYDPENLFRLNQNIMPA